MIPVNEIVDEIQRLLSMKRPEICRHYVCCDLLSILERNGIVVDQSFAKAVVEANDADALLELEKLKRGRRK